MNMQILCSVIAALLISFAWLSPFHTYPWVTFSSELASFGAALAFFGMSLKQEIKTTTFDATRPCNSIISMVFWTYH